MQLPAPRGPLSQQVAHVLADRAMDAPVVTALPLQDDDLLVNEDVQLALWMLFELHYRGFDDVDPDLEWDPLLIHSRTMLEACLEQTLRRLTADDVRRAASSAGDLPEQLNHLIDELDGGSLASHLQRHATEEQFADFLRQRSVYQLKESDPQSFVLPRLDGPAKAALAELQYDEYGAGRPERLHATMFARAMEAIGLDSAYGAHVDEASAITLAVNNVMSMFALRRRLRGAALGHLAAFEATSSAPCRRIVSGIERLGLPEVTAAYFDEHVEADAVHEQLAIRNICGTLVEAEPELADDVLFGAASCLRLDGLAGAALVDMWSRPAPRHLVGVQA
ncbi:iron-containing redox enzyme family protein [Nocardioides sp. JQ2195]|uniref:iron-containing redox enzyme family protein n=1 Tax=Nocardioides sp. JQ2195 TaxID=2592334 RepID=UPI00143E2F31|nr:iron-containing redox enzyme family protein [Nocardioides sp. JQ2195]QIX27112.1 iron-containing redox enzyme family protein [Nocardioides sp. JQ2195]